MGTPILYHEGQGKRRKKLKLFARKVLTMGRLSAILIKLSGTRGWRGEHEEKLKKKRKKGLDKRFRFW